MTPETTGTTLRDSGRATSEPGWFAYRPRLASPIWRGARASFLTELEAAHRSGGDFVKIRLGPVALYLVSDPDAIRTVLVTEQRNFVRLEPERSLLRRVVGNGVLTSMGEYHRRQRRLMQPLFQPRRLSRYAEAMRLEAERLLGEWDARAGRVVDIHAEMMRATLLVIARVLFGRDLRERAEVLSDAVTAANRGSSSLVQVLSGGRLAFLPTRAMRDLRRAVRALDELVYGLIAERRRSGEECDDLLGLLLSARDDEAAAGDPDARMSDVQVRDELVTLFGAGHETTASLLSWTWYLLARHPEVEARLHAEIAEIPGGRAPGFADVQRLVYTEQVLRESMRLFPPAWINGRVNLEPAVVAGRGLPARSIVTVSPWLVHRDPRFFPDPERFDPERFSPEACEGRHRFAYFPFGGGVRQCIGQAFAEVEAKLLLASFAQRFAPRLEPGARVAPEPMVTLRPKGGLPMRLEPRAT
jgi:cytochrome P450